MVPTCCPFEVRVPAELLVVHRGENAVQNETDGSRVPNGSRPHVQDLLQYGLENRLLEMSLNFPSGGRPKGSFPRATTVPTHGQS